MKANEKSQMGPVLTTLTAGLTAIVLFLVHGLDDWLGILAFKYQYLAFCTLVACIAAATWLVKSRMTSPLVGLTVFAILLSPYFTGEPSSRILRSVLINVEAGIHGDEVEEMVRNAYSESGYAMPRISRSEGRIHVSLLSQSPGDCTAAVFYLSNGVVVSDEFSRD